MKPGGIWLSTMLSVSCLWGACGDGVKGTARRMTAVAADERGDGSSADDASAAQPDADAEPDAKATAGNEAMGEPAVPDPAPQAGGDAPAGTSGDMSSGMGGDVGSQPDSDEREVAQDGPQTADESADEPDEPEDLGTGSTEGAAESSTPELLKVSIRFRAMLGELEFACGRKYGEQGLTGTVVTPRDLRVFIHGVALTRSDGTLVPVILNERAPFQSKTLALLDFEDGSGLCDLGTPEVNAVVTGTVPAGSYTGLHFAAGVPAAENHLDPQLAVEPLRSAAGLREGELGGYRFASIGVVQLLPVAGVAAGQVLFHPTAGNCSEMAGGVRCDKANRSVITLAGFDPEQHVVVIDVGVLLAPLDLTQQLECDSASKLCSAMFSAFGVDYLTGDIADSQTLFRFEQ